MTLPAGLVRNVFSKPHPDALLHHLASAPAAPLYTEARDALGFQPEQFRRALGALEAWGLLQLRVVPKQERPDGRRRVRLELTALGHAAIRLHDAMDQAWRDIAHAQGIPEDALAVA